MYDLGLQGLFPFPGLPLIIGQVGCQTVALDGRYWAVNDLHVDP